MKKISLIVVVLGLISFNIHAQTPPAGATDSIKADFMDYLQSIENGEFAKSMDYLIPEFFTLVPKEQMIAIMEQTFNNPEMEVEMKDSKVMEIGDVVEIEEKFYAKLKYSGLLLIKFLSEEQDEETKKATNNLVKGSLEASYGKENVKYDAATEVFEIYTEKDALAISKDGVQQWQFLVIEEQQKAILETLVPKAAIDMK